MAGKFPYRWTRSSMTFDIDFYPEGASEKAAFALRDSGVFRRATAQAFQIVVNEQANGPDMLLLGGQASASLQFGPVTTRLIATGANVTQPELLLRTQLDGLNVSVHNTDIVVNSGGRAAYASEFRYANVIAENLVATRSAAWPLTISGEYQYNLGASSANDTALSFRVDAGRNQRSGDWLLGYHLFRVEQEAILSGLGESDWRAPSNVLQQRFFAARTIHPQVQALVTLYRGRTLDSTVPGALLAPGLVPGQSDPWTNRWYFDVAYRFR